MTRKSRWERHLQTRMIQVGLPRPQEEYEFHPTRKWRFDFAFPELKLAVEVEGGIWGNVVKCHACGVKVRRRLKSGRYVYVREGGRHNIGSGIEADMEKYNEAAILGWTVIKVSTKMIQREEAVDYIERAYAGLKQTDA